MIDLGGDDELSLIRWFGNGSYMRYGIMGFEGCTPIEKYPGREYLDPPIDPTYFSSGNLDIYVDIVRVPADAPGWHRDDGSRETMTLDEAVAIMNMHISPYFSKISEQKLTMRFLPGVDFPLGGEGSPGDVHLYHMLAAGLQDCRGEAADSQPCSLGALGGINRLLLTDVTADGGGRSYYGSAAFGLVSLRKAYMELIVHELGHGWMGWPHSYAEVPYWSSYHEEIVNEPQPYSNFVDFMSSLTIKYKSLLGAGLGWNQDMPSTLAINRYAAGWISSTNVALHLSTSGVYTLQPPRMGGYQFLVVSSGRPYAFTTLEVLDERHSDYIDESPAVYDPSVPGNRRPRRYAGVFISRYDQSTGTGAKARFGPALYNTANPHYLHDVGWSRDDFSVVVDGESREIGGGVRVDVSRNDDGSYNVSVTGGRVAPFTKWCQRIWFASGEYDTGCSLNVVD